MIADFRVGQVWDACERCGSVHYPIVQLYFVGDDEFFALLCVVCLANSIDSVTGWKMTKQVLTALDISPASERFRNPDSRGYKRRSLAPPQPEGDS